MPAPWVRWRRRATAPPPASSSDSLLSLPLMDTCAATQPQPRTMRCRATVLRKVVGRQVDVSAWPHGAGSGTNAVLQQRPQPSCMCASVLHMQAVRNEWRAMQPCQLAQAKPLHAARSTSPTLPPYTYIAAMALLRVAMRRGLRRQQRVQRLLTQRRLPRQAALHVEAVPVRLEVRALLRGGREGRQVHADAACDACGPSTLDSGGGGGGGIAGGCCRVWRCSTSWRLAGGVGC